MPLHAFNKIAFAVLPLLAFSAQGCASRADASRSAPGAPHDDTPRQVTVLGEDISAVREAFEAESSRWRVLALVSPTCSECILGAEAVEQEITSRFGPEEVAALVVWIPMIPTDNEHAAHASAGIFPNGRALQFYDAHQNVGWAYARETFAGFMERARAFVPDDDPLAEAIDGQEGAVTPQWDLYMLYAPGVHWIADAGPPLPNHWIRHTGRRGGEVSVYWRDTPDSPPKHGDLFEAMRAMADDALRAPTTTRREATMRIEVLGLADCPNANATKLAVEEAVASLALEATVQYLDQETLLSDDPRRYWPSPTVLVDGVDLFGMPAPDGTASACRNYAGGAPSLSDVADALRVLARG